MWYIFLEHPVYWIWLSNWTGSDWSVHLLTTLCVRCHLHKCAVSASRKELIADFSNCAYILRYKKKSLCLGVPSSLHFNDHQTLSHLCINLYSCAKHICNRYIGRALQWSGNPYGNGYGLEMDGNGAQFVERLWTGLDLGKAISLLTSFFPRIRMLSIAIFSDYALG